MKEEQKKGFQYRVVGSGTWEVGEEHTSFPGCLPLLVFQLLAREKQQPQFKVMKPSCSLPNKQGLTLLFSLLSPIYSPCTPTPPLFSLLPGSLQSKTVSLTTLLAQKIKHKFFLITNNKNKKKQEIYLIIHSNDGYFLFVCLFSDIQYQINNCAPWVWADVNELG